MWGQSADFLKLRDDLGVANLKISSWCSALPAKIDYLKYPFVASPKEFPQLFIVKPSVLVSKSQDLKDKLVATLREILEKGKVPLENLGGEDEGVLMYCSLLDLAKSLNDRRLVNRIALAYSKTASTFLGNERDDVLYLIGRKLGLNVILEVDNPPRLPVLAVHGKREGVGFKACVFALPVVEYMKIALHRLLHDQSYALVNNIVHGGYIYLDHQSYRRVLEEYIFQVIVSACESATPPTNEEYSNMLKEVEALVAALYGKELAEQPSITPSNEGELVGSLYRGRIAESLFPPCIKKILDNLNSGGNPSHAERFNLVAFLGNIGLDVDELMEYFKRAADFNERVARYQIEHILGLRGSKVKYKPYTCENLKAGGLCPIIERCPGGGNPLAVYRFNAKKLRSSHQRGGLKGEDGNKPPAGFEPATTGSPGQA